MARNVDPALAKAALALRLPGVGAYSGESRTYPMKGSAAQVLGFAGVDNNGLAGLELEYEKQLSGKPGSEVVVRDPAGQAHQDGAADAAQGGSGCAPHARRGHPVHGRGRAQAHAQLVLREASRRHRHGPAQRRDPRHGERPGGQEQRFRRSTRRTTRNRAITDAYEPGSIFKLVTISGALADGTVNTHQRFTLAPTLTLYDRTIHEAEGRGTVSYNVKDILVHSSNVGAVTIGMKMGQAALLKWAEAYGFGKATGIGFPGESTGYVPAADQWSGTTIVNVPMGQGIAGDAAADHRRVRGGGQRRRLRQPHLVEQVGAQVYKEPAGRRVIPARIAASVRKMLAAAVDHGTGIKAKIPGYVVAGKTGHRRRSRCRTAAATPSPTTWPRSSAWCRPTTRGSW